MTDSTDPPRSRKSTRNGTTYLLIATGTLLAAIVASGIFLAEILGRDSPLSVALAAVGIVSFLSLLRIQRVDAEAPLITETSMRSAIAGAIVIEYLVLVSTVAFFRESPERIHPVTETMISNFTMIVGIVVAFYFGSGVLSKVKQTEEKED